MTTDEGLEGRNVRELSRRKGTGAFLERTRDPPTSRVYESNVRDAAREHVLSLTLPSEEMWERR